MESFLLVEKKIGRLHVAVHNTLGMGAIQCSGRLVQPPKRRSGRLGAVPAQNVLERVATQVLHHDERAPLPDADVVDGRDSSRRPIPSRARARDAGDVEQLF